MVKNHPLIFNLTHLIGKRNNLTPTGIDRVDIRYAKFCLSQTNNRLVLFVSQHRSVLRLVKEDYARNLIENLFCRWVEVKETNTISGMSTLQFILRWMNTHFQERLGHLISTKIKKKLKDQPVPVYINCSPLGTQHRSLHDQLKNDFDCIINFCLYDLIPIDYPEYTSSKNANEIHKARVKSMAQSANTIWAISEATQDRFLKFCTQERIQAPKVEVLNIGVEEHIIEASHQPKKAIPQQYRQQLQSPYFVIVSTIEPRKNHLMLLNIWQQLATELNQECPTLVIIGNRGWQIEHVIDIIEKSKILKDKVVELQNVTDDEMIALIQHAQASLFPSFDEGWGMPIAESLTLNTSVICSDIPVLRECSQNQATFIDPLDVASWKKAIISACSKRIPEQATNHFIAKEWTNTQVKFLEEIQHENRLSSG